MRVLICGSRHWKDKDLLYRLLDHVHYYDTDMLIIHGNARGADTLAGAWAVSHAVPCEVYPAQWETYGKAAGPIRNREMLDKANPDVIYAFHDEIGKSKGTLNMIKQAKSLGKEVFLVRHADGISRFAQ